MKSTESICRLALYFSRTEAARWGQVSVVEGHSPRAEFLYTRNLGKTSILFPSTNHTRLLQAWTRSQQTCAVTKLTLDFNPRFRGLEVNEVPSSNLSRSAVLVQAGRLECETGTCEAGPAYLHDMSVSAVE